MAVEKTEETKLMIVYDNEFFKINYLDKEFVRMATKVNTGKISIEKIKSKFQKKMRKKTDNFIKGELFDEATEDFFKAFAKDYGVKGY